MCSRILRHSSWFGSGYTLMLQFTDLQFTHFPRVNVDKDFPREGGPVGLCCLEMANSGAP